jgi:phytol kinase
MSFGIHWEAFYHVNPLLEGGIGVLMFLYILAIVLGTRYTYNIFMKHNLPKNVGVYYNRKIIHIFAAGVVTLLFPIFFTAVTIPLILVALLAVVIFIPHKMGKILYWFQVKENMYEFNFVIAWGLAIGLTWILFGNPIYGVIPAAFMSFGDAATGLVRNFLFKRRTKSWIGNIAMLAVCIPIGWVYAGVAGVVAGIVASIAEHFEFGPIDDNILITLTSLATLLILTNI